MFAIATRINLLFLISHLSENKCRVVYGFCLCSLPHLRALVAFCNTVLWSIDISFRSFIKQWTSTHMISFVTKALIGSHFVIFFTKPLSVTFCNSPVKNCATECFFFLGERRQWSFGTSTEIPSKTAIISFVHSCSFSCYIRQKSLIQGISINTFKLLQQKFLVNYLLNILTIHKEYFWMIFPLNRISTE